MAVIAKQRYKLDIAPSGGWVIVYASQHDNGAREIEFEITNQGNSYSIPASINISVQGIKSNKGYFSHSCSYSGNVVTMALADDMTDVIGKAICVLKFTNSSQQKLATAKFILNVDSDSSSEGVIIDTEAEEIFNQMLNEIRAQAASVSADIAELQSMVGSPLVASTVSAMTNHNKIYVYTGSESGYTNGNWYYWNGSVWTSGGVYNSTAFETDKTLSIENMPADALETGKIKENLDAVCPTPELTWILNKNVDGAGNISTNNYMAVTDSIPVGVGDRIIRKTPSYVNNKGIIGYLSEFNGDTFISRNAFNTFEQIITITNSNTTHVRIAFGRVSSSGVRISQNDVDTYFDVDIYRQAVPYVTYDADAFVNQGRISDLGYTSLSQCAKQGYYTFGSSDSLSDLPVGWGGGGLVNVYKNGNVIWQRLISTRYRFIRYGTTAEWRNEATLVYAQYIAESGENQSDAKLNVFIPRDLDNRRTLYQMGHCVDASANADIWRIMFMYRVDTNGTQRKLTMTGEWECAVKLDGRSDFSGGIVHGDEVDTDVKVFVDGTLTDITTLQTFCHELKIVRHSNMYDPNDSTTIIAEHGVEYIYTIDGLIINQSITWKVSESLANCFLAMLPIIKTYSKYRYDDTSFLVTENNQTNYSVIIPNAKAVTEYSTEYDCSVTMTIPSYPTGLTGGDCALITDNNGLNYNKVYFPVCTSGNSQIGDVWKSTTAFKNC